MGSSITLQMAQTHFNRKLNSRSQDEVAISGNFEIYRQKIEIVMKELQEDQENMDRCQAEWTEFITELEM